MIVLYALLCLCPLAIIWHNVRDIRRLPDSQTSLVRGYWYEIQVQGQDEGFLSSPVHLIFMCVDEGNKYHFQFPDANGKLTSLFLPCELMNRCNVRRLTQEIIE